MNTEEARDSEERRQQFKAALKPFFPTIVDVVEMGDETSKRMKEENRRRREEAFRKRVEKRQRAKK